MTSELNRERVRRFYDRLGAWQDLQRYEGPALDALIRAADFEYAHEVFEFGCGTGRLAERLLSTGLPPDAHYTAIDVSRTMAALAARRLESFGSRAHVTLADGLPRIAQPDGAFDRFVCTYVLDLLDEAAQATVLAEAHRLLSPGGRLCLASLTAGITGLSRVVTALWRTVCNIAPMAVGGCQPTDLPLLVDPDRWTILSSGTHVRYGVASGLLIAARR